MIYHEDRIIYSLEDCSTSIKVVDVTTSVMLMSHEVVHGHMKQVHGKAMPENPRMGEWHMMVQSAQNLLTIRDRPAWLFLLKMLEIDRFVRITILHPTTDPKTIYGSVQAMCGRLMLVTIWGKKKKNFE